MTKKNAILVLLALSAVLAALGGAVHDYTVLGSWHDYGIGL